MREDSPSADTQAVPAATATSQLYASYAFIFVDDNSKIRLHDSQGCALSLIVLVRSASGAKAMRHTQGRAGRGAAVVCIFTLICKRLCNSK